MDVDLAHWHTPIREQRDAFKSYDFIRLSKSCANDFLKATQRNTQHARYSETLNKKNKITKRMGRMIRSNLKILLCTNCEWMEVGTDFGVHSRRLSETSWNYYSPIKRRKITSNKLQPEICDPVILMRWENKKNYSRHLFLISFICAIRILEYTISFISRLEMPPDAAYERILCLIN